MLSKSIRDASLATLVGLVPHYLAFYLSGVPLWTEAIAAEIMADTPNGPAIWILDRLGAWAKPFAVTGGLAALGFAVWAVYAVSYLLLRRRAERILIPLGAMLAAVSLGAIFHYSSLLGQLSFWLPAALTLLLTARAPQHTPAVTPSRRSFLTRSGQALLGVVMSSGTVAVAVESYFRNRTLAARAVEPKTLYSFQPPPDPLIEGERLLRPLLTPITARGREDGGFYIMSENTVDPVIDPGPWRLQVDVEGKVLREYTYEELLSLPRTERYSTLRCISNNLDSDLMGTAHWTGLPVRQLVDPRAVPAGTVEIAFLGADGHGESAPPGYALSDETFLALGMNGKTLNRDHGFPLRVLMPRYYGIKSIKWITRISLRRTPFYGTWPSRGFTKEPLIHTASHIDTILPRPDGLLVGGASFAGIRGIQAVQVRANDGPWVDAFLEKPLSAYTLTRWWAKVPPTKSGQLEARARDGEGKWQAPAMRPLFPDGMAGRTVRSLG